MPEPTHTSPPPMVAQSIAACTVRLALDHEEPSLVSSPAALTRIVTGVIGWIASENSSAPISTGAPTARGSPSRSDQSAWTVLVSPAFRQGEVEDKWKSG